MKPHVLTLPGWQGSGPAHWQSRWEAAHGYTRVEQHDWLHPLRGDWITRLESVVRETPGPLVLAAHSLGCLLVTAWAAISPSTDRVIGALLVTPGDTEHGELPGALHSWRVIARQRLPFRSTLVASQNDPYCTFDRARELARDWGSTLVDAGPVGHLMPASGVADWPQGQALLQALIEQAPALAQPQDGAAHRPAQVKAQDQMMTQTQTQTQRPSAG